MVEKQDIGASLNNHQKSQLSICQQLCRNNQYQLLTTTHKSFLAARIQIKLFK